MKKSKVFWTILLIAILANVGLFFQRKAVQQRLDALDVEYRQLTGGNQ